MIIDPTPIIHLTKSGHRVKKIKVRCDHCGVENLRSWSIYKAKKTYRCQSCANKEHAHFKLCPRNGIPPANKQIKCIVSCLQCGRTKLKSKNQLKKTNYTFCNSKCQNKWQRENTDFNKGKNNPSYKHGERLNGSPAFYGDEFSKKLKLKVKLRDSFICQRCNEKFSGNAGKKLDVHHVDEDKYNNKMDNLVSLCKTCHSKLHWETRRVVSSEL